mgnify:CR=1 FL=1
MLVALSVLFHMVESMIPLPLPVPGFRLGLANIVGLIALYLFNFKIMIGVNLTRVIFASLLKGTLFGTGFWLSLSGVILSSIACLLAKKFTPMSIYGVSVAGSVFSCDWTGHNGNIYISAVFYAGNLTTFDLIRDSKWIVYCFFSRFCCRAITA